MSLARGLKKVESELVPSCGFSIAVHTSTLLHSNNIQNLEHSPEPTLTMNIFKKKAFFSTLSPYHYPWPFAASTLTTSAWFKAAGVTLAAASIIFAPEHEFDNLDCQSYCQRVVDGKEEPPHYHF